jgi:hypothetical protein
LGTLLRINAAPKSVEEAKTEVRDKEYIDKFDSPAEASFVFILKYFYEHNLITKGNLRAAFDPIEHLKKTFAPQLGREMIIQFKVYKNVTVSLYMARNIPGKSDLSVKKKMCRLIVKWLGPDLESFKSEKVRTGFKFYALNTVAAYGSMVKYCRIVNAVLKMADPLT